MYISHYKNSFFKEQTQANKKRNNVNTCQLFQYNYYVTFLNNEQCVL